MKLTNTKNRRALAGKKAEDKSLKAPQSIIHVKHSITLRQYKYWILLLSAFREADRQEEGPDAKGFYRLPIASLTEYLGYEPVKDELKVDFEALRREPIIINTLNKDGKPTQRGMGFISEWEITSKTVGFKLPSFLEDVMRGLDEPRNIFQLLNWSIFNHFSGKYEAIIYKLCRDYVGVGRTPYMTLEAYREYMGLAPTEYPENKLLNKWVISGPSRRINESHASDILVTPEIDKKGRKAVGVRFRVEPKGQAALPLPEPVPHPAFSLAKVPIPPKAQERYLALREAEALALCIERANEYGARQEREGKPPNYGALYRAAIEEGWHVEQARKHAEAQAEQARRSAEAAAKRQAEAEAKARQARAEAEREAVLGRFRALPADEQVRILEAFLATDPQARAAHKRRGFDSPFFLFPFVQFLLRAAVPAA
jgi:hypothetical protein